MKIHASLMAFKSHELERFIEDNHPYIDGFHLDIMDGTLVPYYWELSTDLWPLIRQTGKEVSIHLMVENPLPILQQLQPFLQPTDVVFIHAEIPEYERVRSACRVLHPIIGIAYTPEAPVTLQTLSQVEYHLLLSVEPGRSGQPFLESTWEKLVEVERLIDTLWHPHTKLYLDGGITPAILTKLPPCITTAIMGSGIPELIKERFQESNQ